ncbi:hypothetical protein MYCTH_2124903 [Thermothelomyces thermophilus ATCC 42464]|uniref:Uncharacterized protein n=1 Tax=Thermothelomyces thermophilus (strain ATCC 42464 / BCRC 31852 / DSM 1799) TaxID=573729 RepID=G2QAU5_THET4|nr:uncharacterized protein MYCTH_2124903 [Thermothelomyces thermophilus ATCC 42464]AEO55937.1 hypothetical protein MYCTH_2124903 [Thermothelomyces thermophilus ATCC 42464]
MGDDELSRHPRNRRTKTRANDRRTLPGSHSHVSLFSLQPSAKEGEAAQDWLRSLHARDEHVPSNGDSYRTLAVLSAKRTDSPETTVIWGENPPPRLPHPLFIPPQARHGSHTRKVKNEGRREGGTEGRFRLCPVPPVETATARYTHSFKASGPGLNGRTTVPTLPPPPQEGSRQRTPQRPSHHREPRFDMAERSRLNGNGRPIPAGLSIVCPSLEAACLENI